jgi:hypothetical protein
MDYKYINQLLERYFECQTTLEEEAILRAFFSQEDIPASLLPYRNLFVYEAEEPRQDVLGDDFDARMFSLIGRAEPVKARRISLVQRMRPLFRAAAMVAVVLTLANAMQAPFANDGEGEAPADAVTGVQKVQGVAKCDTAEIDSTHRSGLSKQEMDAAVEPGSVEKMDNQAFIIK